MTATPSDLHLDHVWPRGAPRTAETAARSRLVERLDIERFTEISGERNPLHYDDAVAAGTRFGGSSSRAG